MKTSENESPMSIERKAKHLIMYCYLFGTLKFLIERIYKRFEKKNHNVESSWAEQYQKTNLKDLSVYAKSSIKKNFFLLFKVSLYMRRSKHCIL